VWWVAAASELGRRAALAEKEAGWPWAPLDGFRLGNAAAQIVALRHGEERRELLATWLGRGHYALSSAGHDTLSLRIERLPHHALQLTTGESTFRASAVPDGARLHVFLEGRHSVLEVFDPLASDAEGATDPGAGLAAPMPGKVVAHLVAEGAVVEMGTPLMVLEAMKMELSIAAPRAGVVRRFVYGVGESVSEGAELVVLEPEKAS
jgi:3-methylcrotonyl-CoA carboxylase alpha subunit